MATSKKKPRSKPAQQAPAPATKEAQEPSCDEPTPNYVRIDSTGVYLYSGSTRSELPLTIEEYNAILPLLLKRQQLGMELTALLAERGYTLSVAITIDRGP